MNALIIACTKEDNNKPIAQFPQDLMSDYDKEVVRWVLGYRAKYGVQPSVSRLEKQFPSFVSFERKGVPIWDLYDMTIKRRLVGSLKEKMSECLNELEDGNIPEEILREGTRLLTITSGMESLSGFDRSKYFRSNKVDTGLKTIDELTKGIGGGEVMVISGRLGTGKSTIAQYIACKLYTEGKKVMFVSNEMLASDVFSRIDGFLTSKNPQVFRSSLKGDKDAEEAIESAEREVEGNTGEIYTPSAKNSTPSSVFSLAVDYDVDAMIIDSFYLMRPDTAKIGSTVNWERVLLLSNEIKRHAREANLPVITVTQIKRNSIGSRAGATYDPEDLSFSDAIGHDADFIVAIKPDEIEPARVDVQLIKNRFGGTGHQEIMIDFDDMTIQDPTAPATVTVEPGSGLSWE